MAYLDNAATTPLRPEVGAAMEPYFAERFGNPSGLHASARAARRAVDESRQQLAEVLGCEPGEVVFTSGGTEADNLAVTGAALGALSRGAERAVVCCSAIEHPAVLQPARFLGALELPVDGAGRLDLAFLSSVLAVESEDVALVSVMLVNNELGVVEPLGEVVRLVRDIAPNALVHTDAVQALAWRELAEEAAGADLVTVSAHKVGGPKGTGALVVRQSARGRLSPLLRGGPQERELRAGTENVAGIVGFATAARLAKQELSAAVALTTRLAERLVSGILAGVPGSYLTSEGAERVAAICNIGFPGCDGETLLLLLDQAGVAASAGSACASGALEPSPVLAALGMEEAEARSHIRFSLSPRLTEEEIDEAVRVVIEAAARAVA